MGLGDLAEKIGDFAEKVKDNYDMNTLKYGSLQAPAPSSPVATPTAPRATSPDLGATAQAMMAHADHGFYGHMTIEKCYQMSNTKGALKSATDSFYKNCSNGMATGKKRG